MMSLPVKKIRLIVLIFIYSVSGITVLNAADSAFVIGTFKITKVTDGDTFKFEGLDKSARLLGIDTEETFKTADAEQKTNEIATYWEEFYKNERGDNKMPVKTDSPLGFEAWKWAETFFADVDSVRLEREADDRSVDIFGRYLVYLIAYKNGGEINYNVECVKQGYSPSFNKYGNSKRFNSEFEQAQNFAKENQSGIWDPAKKHYPDYDERIIWWNKRAQQIENYEKNYSDNENYFNLSSEKDFNRLADNIGKEITVFGNIGDVLTKKDPVILRIPYDKNVSFDIVVFEKDLNLLNEIDIEDKKNYYIYVKGILETYKGSYQIILNNKDQVWMEE
ncbi:MAG TPA: thermonuclease family protein [Ignavibacteria bacterium]|nr:thermonuclease family protein [Ignavibacteria bacterium]